MKKNWIAIISFFAAIVLIAVGMSMKKDRNYEFNDIDDIVEAFENELDIDVPDPYLLDHENYNDENVSYLIANMKINDVGYFAVFQSDNSKEDNTKYQCVYKAALKDGEGNVLVDKENHVFICCASFEGEFAVQQEKNYDDGNNEVNYISGYEILLNIENNPEIESISFGQGEFGSQISYSVENIN